jgi:hypothetical protein
MTLVLLRVVGVVAVGGQFALLTGVEWKALSMQETSM